MGDLIQPSARKIDAISIRLLWAIYSGTINPTCKTCVFEDFIREEGEDIEFDSPCDECFGSTGRYYYDPKVPDTPEGNLIRLLILIDIQKRRMQDCRNIPIIVPGLYLTSQRLEDRMGKLMFELETLMEAEGDKSPFVKIRPFIPLTNSWLCPFCEKPVLRGQGQCRIQEGRKWQRFHGKCYLQLSRYERISHNLKLFLVL